MASARRPGRGRLSIPEPGLPIRFGVDIEQDSPSKPLWRGRIHQAAFFVALPAGVALVALARSTQARVAGSVFAGGLAGPLGGRAGLPVGPLSPRALRRVHPARP